MSVTELSTSTQNYLKAIWALSEWSSDPVTPSALATQVGVRPSTVTDAMKKLAADKLIDYTPYGAIAFTPAGRRAALEMVRRHRLIETYLVSELGYTWDEVHDEAESLEHACSDMMIERIAVRLGNPERDPHGDPIPDVDGNITLPDASPLTPEDAGSTVTIERIADADPKLLQHLADHRIGIGDRVHIAAGSPYSGAIIARTAHGEVPLGDAVLPMIWVSRA